MTEEESGLSTVNLHAIHREVMILVLHLIILLIFAQLENKIKHFPSPSNCRKLIPMKEKSQNRDKENSRILLKVSVIFLNQLFSLSPFFINVTFTRFSYTFCDVYLAF